MARSRSGKVRSRTSVLARCAGKIQGKKGESANEESSDESSADLSKHSAMTTEDPPSKVTQVNKKAIESEKEGTNERKKDSDKTVAAKQSDGKVAQGDSDIESNPESTQDDNDSSADELENHRDALEKQETNNQSKTSGDVDEGENDLVDIENVSDSSKSIQGNKTVRSHKKKKQSHQAQAGKTNDDEEKSDDEEISDDGSDRRNLKNKSMKATAFRDSKGAKQGKSVIRQRRSRQSTSPPNKLPNESESDWEETEENPTGSRWNSSDQRTKVGKPGQELNSSGMESDSSEILSKSTGITVKGKNTPRRYGKQVIRSSESDSRDSDSSQEEKKKISRQKTDFINNQSRLSRKQDVKGVGDDDEFSGSLTSAESTEDPRTEIIELIIGRLPGVPIDTPSILAIPTAAVVLRDLRDRLIRLHKSELSLLVNQVEVSIHLGREFLNSMCSDSRSYEKGRRFEEMDSTDSDSSGSMAEILAYNNRRKLRKENQRKRRKGRKPRRTLPQRTATHKTEPESVSSDESSSNWESSSCSFSSASESTVSSLKKRKRRFIVSSSDSWESDSDLEEVNGDFVLHEKHKLRRSSRNQRSLNLRNHSATRRKIAKYCVDDESGSSEDYDVLNRDDNLSDESETNELLDTTIEL